MRSKMSLTCQLALVGIGYAIELGQYYHKQMFMWLIIVSTISWLLSFVRYGRWMNAIAATLFYALVLGAIVFYTTHEEFVRECFRDNYRDLVDWVIVSLEQFPENFKGLFFKPFSPSSSSSSSSSSVVTFNSTTEE
jgi:hypothetical protein